VYGETTSIGSSIKRPHFGRAASRGLGTFAVGRRRTQFSGCTTNRLNGYRSVGISVRVRNYFAREWNCNGSCVKNARLRGIHERQQEHGTFHISERIGIPRIVIGRTMDLIVR
jgi:hypothetical protein